MSKENLLLTLDNRFVGSFQIKLKELSRGRIIEEANFKIYLKNSKEELSQNPISPQGRVKTESRPKGHKRVLQALGFVMFVRGASLFLHPSPLDCSNSVSFCPNAA